MYYFKNISSDIIDLGATGADVAPGAKRAFSDVASREQIADNAGDITPLLYDGLLEVWDEAFVLSTEDAALVVSNNYNKIVIGNASDFNDSKSIYYFLKDNFYIRSHYKIIKHFRGRVSSLYIYPSTDDVKVTIITGDGLILPADDLLKRQTLEIDFKEKVRDIEIHIESESHTAEVDMFIDGFTIAENIDDVQEFINTWYEDETAWVSSGKLVVSSKTDWLGGNGVGTSIINDSDLGNTFVINSDYNRGVGKEFGIYLNGSYNVKVRYNEWDQWGAWNPREFECWLKNVRYIKFNDRTIDIRTGNAPEVIDYDDRYKDGRYK